MRLVSARSPLRRLPATMTHQQVLFFDGLRLSCEMVDLSYERLGRALLRISGRSRLPRRAVATALTDAWAVLDSFERLRRLIPHTPGVKQKALPVTRYLRAAASVEDLRHAVQHLDGEIHACLKAKTPALGLVSWCVLDASGSQVLSASIVSGSTLTGDYPITNPAGKLFQSRLDHVILRLSRYAVDLTDMYRRLADLVAFVEKGLSGLPKGATLGSDLVVQTVFGGTP